MKKQAKDQTLQRESIIPLYYQLMEILIDQIETGLLNPGDPIPSENELCRKYGVSKNTVLQAIQALVNKKLVFRARGKGTYVTNPKITQSITLMLSFSSEMVGLNGSLKNRSIESKQMPALPAIARHLGIAESAPIYHIQILREAQGNPIALQTSFLPSDLCPGLIDTPFEEGSLFRTLQHRYGIQIDTVRETFHAVKSDAYEAKLLEIRIGDPLVLLERISSNKGGRVIELVRTLLRGDRCKFDIELKRGTTS
jgi:GntR family transcriptional regulator